MAARGSAPPALSTRHAVPSCPARRFVGTLEARRDLKQLAQQARIQRIIEVREQEKRISQSHCGQFRSKIDDHKRLKQEYVRDVKLSFAQNARDSKMIEWEDCLVRTGEAHTAAENQREEFLNRAHAQQYVHSQQRERADERLRHALQLLEKQHHARARQEEEQQRIQGLRADIQAIEREDARAFRENVLYRNLGRVDAIVERAEVTGVYIDQSAERVHNRFPNRINVSVIRHNEESCGFVRNVAKEEEVKTTREKWKRIMQEMKRKQQIMERARLARLTTIKARGAFGVEDELQILDMLDKADERLYRVKEAQHVKAPDEHPRSAEAFEQQFMHSRNLPVPASVGIGGAPSLGARAQSWAAEAPSASASSSSSHASSSYSELVSLDDMLADITKPKSRPKGHILNHAPSWIQKNQKETVAAALVDPAPVHFLNEVEDVGAILDRKPPLPMPMARTSSWLRQQEELLQQREQDEQERLRLQRAQLHTQAQSHQPPQPQRQRQSPSQSHARATPQPQQQVQTKPQPQWDSKPSAPMSVPNTVLLPRPQHLPEQQHPQPRPQRVPREVTHARTFGAARDVSDGRVVAVPAPILVDTDPDQTTLSLLSSAEASSMLDSNREESKLQSPTSPAVPPAAPVAPEYPAESARYERWNFSAQASSSSSSSSSGSRSASESASASALASSVSTSISSDCASLLPSRLGQELQGMGDAPLIVDQDPTLSAFSAQSSRSASDVGAMVDRYRLPSPGKPDESRTRSTSPSSPPPGIVSSHTPSPSAPSPDHWAARVEEHSWASSLESSASRSPSPPVAYPRRVVCDIQAPAVRSPSSSQSSSPSSSLSSLPAPLEPHLQPNVQPQRQPQPFSTWLRPAVVQLSPTSSVDSDLRQNFAQSLTQHILYQVHGRQGSGEDKDDTVGAADDSQVSSTLDPSIEGAVPPPAPAQHELEDSSGSAGTSDSSALGVSYLQHTSPPSGSRSEARSGLVHGLRFDLSAASPSALSDSSSGLSPYVASSRAGSALDDIQEEIRQMRRRLLTAVDSVGAMYASASPLRPVSGAASMQTSRITASSHLATSQLTSTSGYSLRRSHKLEAHESRASALIRVGTAAAASPDSQSSSYLTPPGRDVNAARHSATVLQNRGLGVTVRMGVRAVDVDMSLSSGSLHTSESGASISGPVVVGGLYRSAADNTLVASLEDESVSSGSQGALRPGPRSSVTSALTEGLLEDSASDLSFL